MKGQTFLKSSIYTFATLLLHYWLHCICYTLTTQFGPLFVHFYYTWLATPLLYNLVYILYTFATILITYPSSDMKSVMKYSSGRRFGVLTTILGEMFPQLMLKKVNKSWNTICNYLHHPSYINQPLLRSFLTLSCFSSSSSILFYHLLISTTSSIVARVLLPNKGV